MKKLKLLFVVSFLFVMLMSSVSFASWVKEGDNYKFEQNGIFVTNDFVIDGGKTYYFDENSFMVTGIKKIGKYYHVFHDTGAAYKKTESYTYDGFEFEIGSKGKIKNFEDHITDEEYVAYLNKKAAEKLKAAEQESKNNAFAAYQKAINESLEAVIKEQEKLKESERAQQALLNQIIAQEKATLEEYLLSSENKELIYAAANRANSGKKVVDNTLVEIRKQLNARKIELVNKGKEMRAADPLVQLFQLVEDYETMISRYKQVADEILSAAKVRYNINEDKYEDYVEQYVIAFEELNSAFNKMLDDTFG